MRDFIGHVARGGRDDDDEEEQEREQEQEESCKRACALDQPRSAGGRAAPGDLGPVSAPNAGGSPVRRGTVPAPKPLQKHFFFKNCESRPVGTGGTYSWPDEISLREGTLPLLHPLSPWAVESEKGPPPC